VLLLLGVVVGRWVSGLVALQAPAGVTPEPAPIPMPLATPAISVAAKDGMKLVYVPAGKFLMGSTADDPYARDDEKPPHMADLDAFWIDRTEVTNEMFARFVAVAGYKTRAEKIGNSTVFNPSTAKWERVTGANWQHPSGSGSDLTGLEQHPVVHVTWDDADAYCQWAGRRLPTEAEWEKAARGTDGRLYPWGNSRPTDKLSNFGMNVGSTMSVGSYPDGMSPYGALDMSGNVWEWVADYHSEEYYRASPPRNPQGPSSGIDRIMRGGSWYMEAGNIRAAYRGWDDQTDMNVHVGFRCARSA
jgi:formylglycine-generating enzyme required for sulfatase activity